MNKFQVTLTDGTVRDVEANVCVFEGGFLIFLFNWNSLSVAFNVATVKSFRQLPPGAA